jgi:hypothetical protein
MPEEQGPSLEQLIRGLGGQVNQLAQNQAAQARTLAELAQGSQATAQAVTRVAQPAPDPDNYARANARYLETLANDPIGLRVAEKRQMQDEVVAALRAEMAQNISNAERQRHAEEMERQIYQQHPMLLPEGAQLEWYLRYIANHPSSTAWSIDQKVAKAIEWTYEFINERRERNVAEVKEMERRQARAGGPGGGSFRDPGRADAEGEQLSAEEANRKRFEVLQGKKAAAMGGGRYTKT